MFQGGSEGDMAMSGPIAKGKDRVRQANWSGRVAEYCTVGG